MGDLLRFLILVALSLAIWSWLARAQRRTAAKVTRLQARAAQRPPQAIRANPTIAILHNGQIVGLNHIPAADSVAFARDWVPMLQLAPPQTCFSLYDDDPIDDGKLCTVQKDGELWHIRYKGHRHVYTHVIGPSEAVTPDNLWQGLVEVRERAHTEEGGTRRQQ